MDKVLLAFTKNAIVNEKNRQFQKMIKDGWTIKELNEDASLNKIIKIAEESKNKGALEFAVLNEAKNFSFGNRIYESCSNIIHTSIFPEKYSRIKESGLKSKKHVIHFGIMIDIGICTDFNIIFNSLINPAIRFISGANTSIASYLLSHYQEYEKYLSIMSNEYNQELQQDTSADPTQDQSIINMTPENTEILAKVYLIEKNKELIQPLTADYIVNNILPKIKDKNFNKTSLQSKYSSSGYGGNAESIDLANFEKFISSGSVKNRAEKVFLYCLHPGKPINFNMLTQLQDKIGQVICVNNEELRQPILDPVLNKLLKFFKGAFEATGIQESKISFNDIVNLNNKFKSIAQKIEADHKNKAFQLPHTKITNESIDQEEILKPAAMIGASYCKLCNTGNGLGQIFDAEKWNQNRIMQKPGILQKEIEIWADFADKWAKLGGGGFFGNKEDAIEAMGVDRLKGLAQEVGEKRRAKLNAKQNGIDENNLNFLSLHPSFQDMVSILFPGYTVSYS